MTRYVRISHDIVDGEDIEKACQNIAGTSIGSIKSNQELHITEDENITEEEIKDSSISKLQTNRFKQTAKSTKLHTISGISTKFYMTFPITDGKAQLKMFQMPGFGKSYSPILKKLEYMQSMISQPNALYIGERRESQKAWIHSVPQRLGK